MKTGKDQALLIALLVGVPLVALLGLPAAHAFRRLISWLTG